MSCFVRVFFFLTKYMRKIHAKYTKPRNLSRPLHAPVYANINKNEEADDCLTK